MSLIPLSLITLHLIILHHITLHLIILHHITLHLITLHLITLHLIILHLITLHLITLHLITLSLISLHLITLHLITLSLISLHLITFSLITLHLVTLQIIILHLIILHLIILHHITLHLITLHLITLSLITLHLITLHLIILHLITLHLITLSLISLHLITFSLITLHLVTLHLITLHLMTLSLVTLHLITLSLITLHLIILHLIILHLISFSLIYFTSPRAHSRHCQRLAQTIYQSSLDDLHPGSTSNLRQPEEGRLGQIQTRSGDYPEQDCQRDEKIFRTVLLKAASHHIPTGRHRLHEEPVPAEILDVMTRRDDLRKRDPNSLELPRLNYGIQNRIYTHKRQKWRDFVETLDQKTDVTKLWRTIKGIDGRAKREAENEVITFNGISLSSSKQLATKFNQQFNTSKLGRHTSSD